MSTHYSFFFQENTVFIRFFVWICQMNLFYRQPDYMSTRIISGPICLILQKGMQVSSPTFQNPQKPQCSRTIILQIHPLHSSNSRLWTLPSLPLFHKNHQETCFSPLFSLWYAISTAMFPDCALISVILILTISVILSDVSSHKPPESCYDSYLHKSVL